MTLPFELSAPQSHAVDYQHFILDSPSPFHAADLVAQRLVDAGFSLQDEADPWDASPGGHVMVRAGAVAAWVVPDGLAADAGFRVVGAHTDSPALQIKPSVQSAGPDGFGQVDVEIYGGMIQNSWLDRELAAAGRLMTADGRQVLVRTGAIARIPQLAIHLDRSVNESLSLDPQRHMHPVWTVDSEADLLDLIATAAGLSGRDEIVSHDLILTPAQGPGTFGEGGRFFASSRQDNLSSVHAGLRALERLAETGTAGSGDVLVFMCFDHEEIGSATRTGAAGPILETVLRRTAGALGRRGDEVERMLAASSCVSADAAHSVHPNYADRHDPAVRPVLGRGPVLKINANQRYATDAEGAALWRRACDRAGVDSQVFVSNNAMPCGSTIGPITATRLGLLTVDVGVGLLSMHSAREMSHVDDLLALSQALEAYWSGA
ncbi:M18 family aminopeptidase [Actinomyces sp. B33]|uniref:M18 family aminopeptidase n=1 Tax=Actinomyces sp. B33 TaxID=2942131 RepID=UPI0023426166|nr:M18 family aminopeptidase [Actinomyces sp. B33]MDC4232273.1 M18 family aminopeptidase [Actinomyces sp. B33]